MASVPDMTVRVEGDAIPFAYEVRGDDGTTIRFEAPTAMGLLELVNAVAPDALTAFEPRG